MGYPHEQFYPTASTVAVFLNGIHVDQAYRLDYRENQPKTPIYGYNDYEYTKVVRGKGLVQGILLTNFTVPFYLNEILSMKQDAFVPSLYNYSVKTESLNSQVKQHMQQEFQTELPANSDEQSKVARAEYIASLLVNKNPDAKKSTKEALYSFFDIVNPSFHLETASLQQKYRNWTKNDPTLYNAGNFETKIQSPLLERTMSKAGNTMDVYYHDPEYVPWFTRFEQVEFFDISQQISQAGAEGSSEPLYEIAQFMAKSRHTKIVQ